MAINQGGGACSTKEEQVQIPEPKQHLILKVFYVGNEEIYEEYQKTTELSR